MGSSSRWKEIEELFEAARQRPAGERSRFLEEACGADTALRREVESLLESSNEAGDFLARPAVEDLLPTVDLEPAAASPAADRVGQTVGTYRLVEVIASGGMGTVYLAERADAAYRQQVAVKLIKRGMSSDAILDRFRKERQALAALDHPNIAKLLDGGSTPDGSPYLVMEYIEGTTIDRYCDDNRLTITERLELFRKVCAAVSLAHRNLVVHRDIKPSNILVTGEGDPKLLDFGIAKLLDPELLRADATATLATARFLTPEYASPEQIRGEAVGTATDVYSLGVVLYELLTAQRPYRFTRLLPAEMERVICDEEPLRPSSAVLRASRLPAGETPAGAPETDRETIGRTRGLSPERLRRRLAGDLDNVVLMALRKEPERRYASVEQFSEDLRRHLEGLPVRARKDTFLYRTVKFVRRNRLGVSAVALFVLALSIATVIAWREAARARLEFERADRFRSSIQVILEDLTPSGTRGLTLREALDRRAADLIANYDDRPEEQVAFIETIADVYSGLGGAARAAEFMEQATEAHRRLAPEDELGRARRLAKLGRFHFGVPETSRAREALRESLEIRERLLDRNHPEVADSLASLGNALWFQGDFEAAETMLRRALEIRRAHPDREAELREDVNRMGRFLQDCGRYEEALPLVEEALRLTRRRHPGDHLDVARMLFGVGGLLQDMGRYREALEYADPYMEMLERIFRAMDGKHRSMAAAMENYCLLLKDLSRYEEALDWALKSLDLRRELFGEHSAPVAHIYLALAKVHYARESFTEARDAAARCLALYRKHFGTNRLLLPRPLVLLGRIHLALGDPVAAEPLIREGLEHLRESHLPPSSWKIHRARCALGVTLARQGKHDAAEPLLLESYPPVERDRGLWHPRTREILGWIIELYEKRGESARAGPYRKKLEEAEALYRQRQERPAAAEEGATEPGD